VTTTTMQSDPAQRDHPTRPLALRQHPEEGARVQAALRAAVADLASPVRQIVTYHFGWADPAGRPAEGDSGKMFRAALVLRCAEAVAGSPDPGLAGAVAVELIHNSSLLQDDVMDLDRTRRHRPTAWTIFGASPTLLAGNALLVLALRVLLRGGGSRAVPATHLLAESYQHLIVGQTLDVEFESRPHVPLRDSHRMANGKTAALLKCAAQMGALLAGAPDGTVSALGGFGRHLGMAFQFVDDILGIWGDQRSTGKPVGADIRARKKSLPVAYALEKEPGRLASFYAGSDVPTSQDVERVRAALEELGARTWAANQAQNHLHAATASLTAAGLPAEHESQLLALAHMVTRRTS
jgi:geranylgeranyl diphosphate synthase type I